MTSAAAAPQRENSQTQNIKIGPCRDGQGGEALIIVQTITHKAFLRVDSHGTHSESINWRGARIVEASNQSQRTGREKEPGGKKRAGWKI